MAEEAMEAIGPYVPELSTRKNKKQTGQPRDPPKPLTTTHKTAAVEATVILTQTPNDFNKKKASSSSGLKRATKHKS